MSKQSILELQALALSELRTHRSEKWRSFPEDVLPLPVAEMDFPVAEPIRQILREMVDTSDLGYLGPIPELGRAFSGVGRQMPRKFVSPPMLALVLLKCCE
jgi:cystathionine beta-lyase